MAWTAGSLRSAGSTPGSTHRLVPGRLRELDALQVEQRRSEQGELRVALILGEAGLGKTRLATAQLPRDGEPTVGLIARSSPLGGMPLLRPWADALGLHPGELNTDGVCRACGSGLGGLPALVRRAEIAHDASSCAQALRYHFVEWIPGLLAKASADRPIVVVLDDVHHGQEVVWEMLLRLGWDFPTSRLFVLATARPAELARHRMAGEVLHALEQQAMVCRIQLAPFSREDVRELATGILGRDRVPSSVVDWLMARAQGNPRCAVGLLEALVDNGADLPAPASDPVPVSEGVPEKLACWVRTEVARLDPPALALVEVLAVGGDLIDLGDLARITDRPIGDVALALDRLVRCGMVLEQQHDRIRGYQIAHPLIREVLSTDIGGAMRRVMHRRVAGVLLESGRTQAASAHFVRAAQAGDDEAVDALIGMAQRAEQQGLCSHVWQTVSTLWDLLPIGDQRWLRVFGALFQRSNWAVVDRTEHHTVETATVRRMRRMLAGVGDLQRQADVRLWLAGLSAFGAGDLDAAQRECRQALELYERAGCPQSARMAEIELARMRGWAGDLPGAELAARQLLGKAQRVGKQRGIVEAFTALGHALGWQGRFEEAEDMLLRSVELATAAGRLSWMSQSLALLASFDACRGHLVSARTRWVQAAAASSHYDPMIGGCGALIELLAGDLAMVVVHAQQAPGHDPAARSRLPARLAARAAMAEAERGHLTEARRHLEVMTRSDGSAAGVPATKGARQPWYWWAAGVVARAEGRWATASTALQRAVDDCSAMNLWALAGFVLADLAEVAVTAGDSDAATKAATSARDNACRRTGAPIGQALHQFATAWALLGRGHHDQAARAALHAVDGFDSSGYALWAARARVAYANAARRSDPRAAEEAVREAVAAFDICGAAPRCEQARTLLHHLGSAQLSPVRFGSAQLGSEQRCTTEATCGPGTLTGRERQVVELAAGGYTAPQIATQLHIGVRTVETHLARSYPKLGITSKQQLVRHAAELGLTLSP